MDQLVVVFLYVSPLTIVRYLYVFVNQIQLNRILINEKLMTTFVIIFNCYFCEIINTDQMNFNSMKL